MSRKPIFDSIKEARGGKPFMVDDVREIDTFLTKLGVPVDPVPGAVLSPSARIEAFIKDFEKCERRRPDGLLQAYMPTPNDVPTIGWGSTGPDITMKTVWTQEQADARFAKTLDAFGRSVEALLAGHPTTQDQYDAMVSLAYNIGVGAFSESTLLKMHRAANYDGAAGQFPRWNKQAGKVLNGLTRRREAEARIYKGLPA